MISNQQEFRKTLVRYGQVTSDKSWEDNDGHYREMVFEYEKKFYRVRMMNGEVITIGNLNTNH